MKEVAADKSGSLTGWTTHLKGIYLFIIDSFEQQSERWEVSRVQKEKQRK